MRILPVVTRFFTNNTNTNTINRQNAFKPQFTADDANDTFQSYSILDLQINEMQDEIENKIKPYKEMIKEKFNIIGKIGYDTQEKLKLIRTSETELMNKKFEANEQPVFKKADKRTEPYEKYQKNIKEFETTEKFVKNSSYYSTPQILKTIEKSRAKVYRDTDEFSKLQPLYDTIQNTKNEMSDELDLINSHNLPEFSQKIKELDDKNLTAVMLALVSGYPDAVAICKKSDDILKAYKEKSQPSFKLLEQVEALNGEIQRFDGKSSDNNRKVVEEMDKFIDENIDYEDNILSKSEINQTYQKLLQDANIAIKKYTDRLAKHLAEDKTTVSPRIIDRTLKSQAKANKTINELIQKEKQKFYEQINSNIQR